MAKKKGAKKTASRKGGAEQTKGDDPNTVSTEEVEAATGKKKKERRKRERDPNKLRGRMALGKQTAVFFMSALIQGGYYAGGKLPTDKAKAKEAAGALMLNAEQLARQARKFGEGDIQIGGGEGSEGSGDGEGEGGEE